jgi:hypothetical protein
MRKLLTTLAGVTLALGLAAPAWADTAQKPADRPITASGDRGHSGRRGYGYGYGYYGCNDPYGYGYRSYGDSGSERPTRFGSSSDDPLGDGRSHYDKLHHDDDSILF